MLWQRGRTTWLAEVKTVSVEGQARPVRYGIGQLLHYAATLQLSSDSNLVLVTDVPLPSGPLRAAPERAGFLAVDSNKLAPLRLPTTIRQPLADQLIS